MIFLLDILLILNLYLSYKRFKYIISPPFLMGGGMLLASLIATLYYEEWDIYDMSFDTVLIIGGGTLLFTLYCILFSSKRLFLPKYIYQENDLLQLNIFKLKILLCILIVIGLLGCLVKYMIYTSAFGVRLDIASLILAARETMIDDSSSFEFPLYVKGFSYINSLFLFFTIWVLAVHLHSRKKDAYLLLLLFCQIIVVCIDGLFSGAKGGVMDPIIYLIFLNIFLSYYKKNSFKMPVSFYKKVTVIFLLFVMSFQSFNSLIGREMDIKSTDFFAAYCGAEIKNFDTYIQNQVKFGESRYLYGTTFSSLYQNLGVKDNSSGRVFDIIDDSYLGNVYTQYYSYYRDGGWLGVFIILMIIAFFSMKVYNYALNSFKSDLSRPSISIFIYLLFANNLFMSFFSSRFTEGVVQVGFLKTIICFMILMLLYKKTLISRKKMMYMKH